MSNIVTAYFETLAQLAGKTQASAGNGQPLALEDFFARANDSFRIAARNQGKLIFIGNGGSAAIASHMANDWCKNGGIPATTIGDGTVLTCLSNDLGYDQAFAYQISMLGRATDVLVAISSSGSSPNILNAVATARTMGLHIVTLSGFAANNPLRDMGDLNLYVPSSEYGFVEVTHNAMCHAMVDLAMGWTAASGLWERTQENAAPAALSAAAKPKQGAA